MISSSESKLDRSWSTLRQKGRTALVPYLTAGYPSFDLSLNALRAAQEFSDVIEVGVPFSDPVADGPTIQGSSFAALEAGMTLQRTLELIDKAALERPVVLFSYLNPVLRHGLDRLLAEASQLGVAGLLLTDLPSGSDRQLERQILDSPIDLIRLVAPNSTPERIAESVADAEGFLYLVARLGVTGTSEQLASGLADSVSRLREHSSLPIAVGFGISNGEQAREVAGMAEGVVIGSALVKALGERGVEGMVSLLAELRHAIDGR